MDRCYCSSSSLVIFYLPLDSAAAMHRSTYTMGVKSYCEYGVLKAHKIMSLILIGS